MAGVLVLAEARPAAVRERNPQSRAGAVRDNSAESRAGAVRENSAESRAAVRESSYELIAAGLQLAAAGCGPVRVLIVCPDPSRQASELAVPGVEAVLTIPSPLEQFESHLHAAAVKAVIEAERPQIVLASDSADAMGFAPAVAAELGLGFASDATGVAWEDGAAVATRPTNGNRLVARLEFPGKATVLVMLRAGAYQRVAPGNGSADVRDAGVTLDASSAATEHLGYRRGEPAAADITEAAFVIAIGRGVEDQSGVAELERIAVEVGAALSVSGGLVDSGLVSPERKVGMSGKTIRPKVYLALGISGALQHLTGIRNAGTVIAVNTDPTAPIFRFADYGAVADLFEVARALPRQFQQPQGP